MTALKTLLAFVRKLLLLALLILAVVAGLLPGLTGLALRASLTPTLESLQADGLIQIERTNPGWFSTEYELAIHAQGTADGAQTTHLPARLHVNHGPMMWHLYDTRVALADFSLVPASPRSTFSASALLRLTPKGHLRLNGIAGLSAYEGDHWLETRAVWPLRSHWQGWQAVLRDIDLALNIDANATALLRSPQAEALRVYQQQGWAHVSNGRARSTIRLQEETLDINGTVMPVGLFLASP